MYDDPNTFYVVPNGLSFQKDDLAFVKNQTIGGDVNTADLNYMSSFSSQVNFIPQLTGKSVSDGSLIPKSIFEPLFGTMANPNLAILADDTLTPEQSLAYQQAQNTLALNGQMTSEYIAYRTAQLNYNNASINYNLEKSKADSSSDQTVKDNWEQTEPLLKADLDALMDQWITIGYKKLIEDAKLTVRLLSGSNSQMWGHWKDLFNQSVLHSTIAGDYFYVTTLNPVNFADPGSVWQYFEIKENEIDSLINNAPNEIKELYLGSYDDAASVDIKFLSCEIKKVDIFRPWMDPNIFNAKFWKFNDPDHLLSDGDPSSPSGDLIAYPTSILFVKNLKVTLSDSVQNVDKIDKGIFLGAFKVDQKLNAKSDVLSKISPSLQGKYIQQLSVTKPSQDPVSIQAEATPAVQKRANRVWQNIRVRSFSEPPALNFIPVTPVSRPSDSTGKDNIVSVIDGDTFYVLAFICKQLPRCPDPDPDLKWA